MVAAACATAVPLPMATPMSALVKAGASLTPSPVMATTCPLFCSARTMFTLVTGVTRANTATSLIASGNCAGAMRSSSAPVIARPSRPSSEAIAAAVSGWSPVIILTVMPACLHWAIAAFASALGGSTSPTSPTKVRSATQAERSPDALNASGALAESAGAVRDAISSPRIPCLASSA